MRKLLAGLLLLLTTTVIAHESIPDKILDWTYKNVWSVGTKAGAASGFWVSSDIFVTACHAVSQVDYAKNGDALVFVVNNQDTRLIQLKLEICDTDRDIAILTPYESNGNDKFETEPTEIKDMPPLGTALYTPGFPLGLPLVITQGHVASKLIQSFKDGGQIITNPTIMGDSGSPVLVLENCEVKVVGIRLAVKGLPQGNGFTRFTDYMTHITIAGPGTNILKVIKDGINVGRMDALP